MANNYLQFSCVLPVTEPAERAWWERLLATQDDEDGDLLRIVDPDGFGYRGFGAELDDDGVWFYADEFGDPDRVARVVQEFFRQCDKDGFFGFEWAETCSKPRVDEFSGGAVLVTADEIRWMHTSRWLVDQLAEHTGS